MQQKGFLDAHAATPMAWLQVVHAMRWHLGRLLVFLTRCEKVLLELLAVKHLRVGSVFRRLILFVIEKQMINSL